MKTIDVKIVCIVDKEHIANAINNININQVLFTILGNSKPLLFINENGCSSKATNNWDILLIHYPRKGSDQERSDVSDRIRTYFPDNLPPNTLVMWHKNASGLINEVKLQKLQTEKRIRKWKGGAHISGDHNGYARLRHLSTCYSDNTFKSPGYKYAKNELIKWFDLNEKLNAALDYLHESLGGTPAKRDILTKGDDKFDLDKKYNDKKLKDWIKELNKSKIDYNKALADVRDALLKQVSTFE